METAQKLNVLVHIKKHHTLWKEFGIYTVSFLYSDEAKNFKGVAECTPEVQELAAKYTPDIENDLHVGTFHYFNCRLGKNVKITLSPEAYDLYRRGESIPTLPECYKSGMILDHFESDTGDDHTTWHFINHFVTELTNYGSCEKGKVFVKCGNMSKTEVKFSIEGNEIDAILDSYLG